MKKPSTKAAGVIALLGAASLAYITVTPGPTSAVSSRSIGEDRPSGVEVLATSAAMTVTREGPWVNYTYTQPLRKATILTYEGTLDKDGAGCLFTGEEIASASEGRQAVVHEREVSTNIDMCIMKTERGIDPSIPIDGDSPVIDGEARETEWATDPDSRASRASSASLLASYSAWHKTFYEDPPGLNVNSARTFVDWVGNGTCVTSSSNHHAEYGWLSATGWRKEYSSVDANRTCGAAYTESNSGFLNQPFCLPIAATRTNYRPNLIRAKPNGVFQMEWSAHKEGDCASLLSFHRSHS